MLAASVIIGRRLARRAIMITAGWMLDEIANAGRENLDADHVARYDRKEDAGASAEVDLLRSLGMGRESVVVDLGAGTGQFALAAAPFCARVVAADVSPVMLRALRSKVAHAGLANIDVVQTGFALHHLPDAWKAVALVRMRRMLAADGIVRLWDVVYGFPPDEAEERIEQWCATGSEDVGGGWYREELEEHVRDEHSTYTWLLEPMIARAGFRIRTVDYSNDGFFAKYVLEGE
jgi:ubiquinone/menaquinone biosynthesis C-methylase UbiE